MRAAEGSATPLIVDAHSHFDKYGDRLPEALRQVHEGRILTVAVAMDVASYRRIREIAAGSPYLVPTFGIHPWEAPRWCDRLPEIDAYLRETPLVGECGLDFHWVTDKTLYPCQETVFEYQCERAGRLGKPMNLHTKGAEREVLEAIKGFKVPNPIVHWYSGPLELIEPYLSEGAYFTVGVECLVSEEIRAVAAGIPLDRLLLETDNPGGQEWLTGVVGMPDLIFAVLSKVASLKEVDPGELQDRLWQNWRTLTADLAVPGGGT